MSITRFSFCTVVSLCLSTVVALAGVVVPVREDAMNNPHKHAWDLFMALNHPAKDPKVERGVPDETKKIGDPGLTVWETWKHAGREVFLSDGSKPPPWETIYEQDLVAKTFDAPKPVVLEAISRGITPEELQSFNLPQLKTFLSSVGDIDPGDGGFGVGGGETRMNKATFDFIVDDNNQLYNIEGQEKFFQDVLTGVRKPLSFPVGSMEIKSMWIPLSADDVAAGKDKTYHTGKDKDGNLFGLVALHIITKDVPNWFWTSFHHIGDRVPLVPPQDTYGQPDALKGTKWEFYGLSGTQTDFVDSTGRATLLSDPHIENGFERSSCISCHAQATIGARPASGAGANRLPVFQIQRTNPDFLSHPAGFDLPSNYAAIGVPFPDQYFDTRARLKYMQLDFLFSLHFRAARSGN